MNYEALLELNSGPLERVGFILQTGEIVEVENVCEDAENGFEVKGEDLLTHMESAVATWHTHPGATSSLSANDFYGFRDYPDWRHVIVGEDGLSVYVVHDGQVLREAFHAR